LESQLEQQSSEADNAISEWQECYTALEVRSSELETQLEALTKEKEELLSAERLISEPGQSPAFEELLLRRIDWSKSYGKRRGACRCEGRP
jgi:chromosome segregation ATPase